jgi:hypothetical protein
VIQRWQNLGGLSKFILNWSELRGKAKVFAGIVSWAAPIGGFARVCVDNENAKAGETPAFACESVEGLAGSDGARLGGNRDVFHRFGAAALATGPGHDHLSFGACGDCGFQPAAFFFHDLLLQALSLLRTICPGNAAGIWEGRQLWPFRLKFKALKSRYYLGYWKQLRKILQDCSQDCGAIAARVTAG